MADQLINQLLWPRFYILRIAVPLIIAVAMFVYWERKVIGWMHVRMGPNKIGPFGLLQAFADVVKLLIKEVILPTNANRFLYFLAPLLALIPALAAWAVIPFSSKMVLANANAGVVVPAGDDLAGRVRHHPRRLGFQLALRAAGRDAFRRAGDLLRTGDGLVPGVRAGPGRQPEPHRHRQCAGRAARACSTGSGCRCCRCS